MKDKLKETIAEIFAYLFKMERKTLLWTNSDSSRLDAQTLSIDLSEYKSIEVEFVNSMQSVRVPINGNPFYPIAANWANYPNFREVRADANGITFSDCWIASGAGGSTPLDLVPTKIYGIKVGGGTP